MTVVKQLRAALPRHCLRSSTRRSLGYLSFDVAVLATLYVVAWRSPVWLAPLFWFAQGTMFWALFVLGHDCGHGSFSRRRWLNTLVGHLTHTPLLVPYDAWRLSHRRHHRHAGDVERDEGWHPLTAAQVEALPWYVRVLRFRLVPLVFPFYLTRNSPGRVGSHFDPRAALFPAGSRAAVKRSVACCGVMALGLLGFAVVAGPGALLRYYLGPYVMFVVWIDIVTYLHHTGADVPWYRGIAWSFEKGALSTIDRSYGVFEWLHHNAGCHVVHHLLPEVPHYHLRAAASAIRPLLGARYRDAHEPILPSLLATARSCHVVPAHGGVVRYEPLPSAYAPSPLGRLAGSRPATR